MSHRPVSLAGGEITIVVPGVITPWKRPRKKRLPNGVETWFNDPKVESYLAVVRHEAALVMGETPPLECAVELSLLAVCPIIKSLTKRDRELAIAGQLPKTTLPDLDNYLKGAKDAIRQVVYRDDGQVVSYGRCAKIYGLRPRLELRLTIVDGVAISLPREPVIHTADLFAEAAA